MKICICTTPIRSVPSSFPPFGAMAIIQSIRDMGEAVNFYNIDYHRPGEKEVRDYFKKNQFDVVGISAVVSTSYKYTKKLTKWIRLASPTTKVIVGGNLAASAEILLKKCCVDYCVIGDGELIVQNLIKVLHQSPVQFDKLKTVRGIAFLDADGEFTFTGFAKPNPGGYISPPDYSILEDDGSFDYYVSTDIVSDFYGMISEEESIGKRSATIITSKGCVNRCTFCHRWEKGYRVQSIDHVIGHLKYLQSHFNVQYVAIGDEDFGSNRELTKNLVKKIGELGIEWRCAGVRVRGVSPEILRLWKDNGCLAVFFGIESGSQKILDVMEKKSTVEMNLNTLKWTHDTGLFTIIQLVIGMPGEDDKSIKETISFLKKATPYLSLNGKRPSSLLSINYAQALPGSPLYEYARLHGFIGRLLDEEEKYLFHISDTDAYRADHFVNFTHLPMLKVRLWRQWILAEVDAHYLQKHQGITLSVWQIGQVFFKYILLLATRKNTSLSAFAKLSKNKFRKAELVFHDANDSEYKKYMESGYFNINISTMDFLFLNPLTKKFFYPLLAIGVARGTSKSVSEMLKMILEHVVWSIQVRLCFLTRKKHQASPNKSLRKLIKEIMATQDPLMEDVTAPLRNGR